MPGEVLWPTLAFATLILTVFGGVALLRLLPRPPSRATGQPEPELLDELKERLGQLDQLQERIGELEERVDFTERLLARQRDVGQQALPQDQAGTDRSPQ